MQRATALIVMLSVFVSLCGDVAHACLMEPEAAADHATVGEAPCHGRDESPARDCCDEDGGQHLCLDCACAAIASPASVPEAAPAPAAPCPAAYPSLDRPATPPDEPPDNLLRPPIVSV